MIQRIQSLYLLATTLIIASMSLFPIAEFIGDEGALQSFNFLNFEGNQVYPITFFVGLITLSSLVSIFLFKNRTRQYRFTNFIIILSFFLIALIAFYIFKFEISIQSLRISAFLPIIAIITTYLARIGIKKDINIIRSVDRIR